MKDKIVYFPLPRPGAIATEAGKQLRINAVASFGLIDCLIFAWLFAWSMFAGFQCLAAAKLISF
jgi:hypothetical protein